MKYHMVKDNNEIHVVGTGIHGEEITEAEYNEIISVIHNRPTPPAGFDYKLKADTLTWELVELPTTDYEASESDYMDALNTLGVDTNEEN